MAVQHDRDCLTHCSGDGLLCCDHTGGGPRAMSILWDILGVSWEWIAGGVAALAGIFLARKSGKYKARADHAEDRTERAEAGRERLKEGRDSGLSPADRVRRNDGDW